MLGRFGHAPGEEPLVPASSSIVEFIVALVEDIEAADDLQRAPAATAVEQRVVDNRTAPPAVLLVVLVPSEKHPSFDIPAVKSWIGDADEGIRCARKASCAWRVAAYEGAAR